MSRELQARIDLLGQLTLPDRYEQLAARVGAELANILVPPGSQVIEALKALLGDIRVRGEGVMVPLYGPSGAGKTTLASNATHWFPGSFTQTVAYNGNIEFDELADAVREFRRTVPADDKRVIPINIDHRESNPPSEAELSTIKRFLRTNPAGVPALIFGPRQTCQSRDRYTWRRGDFLVSANRSNVAQYVLTKLQNYVRQLGWTKD
jgi:hypothetical protein